MANSRSPVVRQKWMKNNMATQQSVAIAPNRKSCITLTPQDVPYYLESQINPKTKIASAANPGSFLHNERSTSGTTTTSI